jgi:hypothetical protein
MQVKYMIEAGRPDLARRIAHLTSKWVDQARRTLNQKTGDAMFGDTVCGNCAGALRVPARVAWDDQGVEVECVGTPTTAPCGETYPMSEWLELYESQRRNP